MRDSRLLPGFDPSLDSPRDTVSVLARCAEHYGERPVILASEYTLSYNDLWDRAKRFAGGLQRLGVTPGDPVLTVMGAHPDYIKACYGILMAGGTVVPIHERQGPLEIRAVVENAKPAVIILAPEGCGDGMPVDATTARIVTCDGCECDGAHSFAALLECDPTEPLAMDSSLPAYYQPTSGSTSTPRLAIITRSNLAHAISHLAGRFAPVMTPGQERILSPFPLGTVAGVMLIHGLMLGLAGSLVFCSDPSLMKVLERFRPTIMAAMPTVFARIADSPDFDKLGSYLPRLLYSGSAPLPAALVQRFSAVHKVAVAQGYGLTEATGICTLSSPGEEADQTVGVATPPTEVVILDPGSGQQLGSGEVGEVAVRGPQVFAGYLNDPEGTANVLRDGLLLTGDIGQLEEDGRLRILGRKRLTIITGGFNVYPPEVEAALYAHSGVREAAVFGLPDREWGEVIVAVVIPAGEASITPNELRGCCRDRLSAYKVPKKVFIADDLPRAAGGKPDYQALFTLYAGCGEVC